MDRKQVFAVVAAVIILISSIYVVVAVCNKSDTEEFSYLNIFDRGVYSQHYHYDDAYFMDVSTNYNPSLATLSLCAAMASTSLNPDKHDVKAYENIERMLKDMGFTEIEANEDFKSECTENSMGVIIGQKEVDGKILLAVSVRSFNYGLEWVNNFTVGTGDETEGMHEGFYNSSTIVINFIKDYIKQKNITGDIKLWLNGFSRGAAVSNITAGRLDNEMEKEIVTLGNAYLQKNDFYVYTFETPMGAMKDADPDPHSERYNNIFNIIYDHDLIPMLMFENDGFGFARFGVDKKIPVKGDKNYNEDLEKMLEIYYKMPDKNVNLKFKIDDFVMKKLVFYDGLPMLVEDKDKADWTIHDLAVDLTNNLSSGFKDRATYCEEAQDKICHIMEVMCKFGTPRAFLRVVEKIAENMTEDDTVLPFIQALFEGDRETMRAILIMAVEDELEEFDVEPEEFADAILDGLELLTIVIENSEDPEQCTSDLATIFDDGESFMSPHYPQIVLAWLMSKDPIYS